MINFRHWTSLLRSYLANEPIPTESQITMPEGWFVYSAGQEFLHMLWYVELLNFNDIVDSKADVRRVNVMEHDSYEEALQDAIAKIDHVK